MPDPAPKSRLAALGQAAGIRPGEGATALLLLGQAFFLGVALLTAYTPANAMFLAAFSTDWIPHTYLAAAVVVTFAGLAFLFLSKRVRLSVLLVGCFVMITAGQIALWLGLRYAPSDRLTFAAMVWFRLFWVVGNLALWALVNRLLDVRQAKRLFPLITASCVLAIIVSGAAISPLVALLGALNLTGVSAGGLVLALVLLLVTVRANADRLGLPQVEQELPKEAAKDPQEKRAGSWRRYLGLMSIYTAFSTVGTYVLDYAFLGLARSYFTGAEDLARFFGYYLSAMTFCLLLFTVGVSGRLFRRFGMSSGVLANPALVAVGAVASAVAGAVLGPGASLFFFAVVATKLFDELMVPSMTTPSVRILLQPLDEDARVRAQAVVESVVAPLSIGLAGLLILIFAQVMRLSALDAIYLLLVLLVGWLILGLRLARAYLGALRQALASGPRNSGAAAESAALSAEEVATHLAALMASDSARRYRTLRALSASDYQLTNAERLKVEQLLAQEGELGAHWVAVALDDTSGMDPERLASLERDRLQAAERAILAAALLGERSLLVGCLPALRGGDVARRSLALEGLDTALPKSIKRWLLPLVRDITNERRQRELAGCFPEPKTTEVPRP